MSVIIYFMVFLITLAVGSAIILYKNIKTEKGGLFSLGSVLIAMSFFLIPFVDPLQIHGYLGSIISWGFIPTIFGVFVGFLGINSAIYGIYIFINSMSIINAPRFKGQMVDVGEYSKRRHPIHASYHLIGSCYAILMGSITGVIIMGILMIYLNINVKRVEEKVLIPRFGDLYKGYKINVPKRLYSKDVLIILLVSHIAFFIGLIGAVFFPML